MQEEVEFGNIKVKMEDSNAEVYKCSHLKCNAFFLNYQDLQTHKIMTHGDTPKFFLDKNNNDKLHKHFSRESLRMESTYILKYKINMYKMMLKAFIDNAGKKDGRTTTKNNK